MWLMRNVGTGTTTTTMNTLAALRRLYRTAMVTDVTKKVEVVEQTKLLSPHRDEVIVDVDCAGVNHSDLRMCRGMHHLRPTTPFVPGFELAGTVVETGKDVTKFNEGDRVVALKVLGTGAFAQRCVVRQDELHAIPYALDFDVAASLPVAYGSAFLALEAIAKQKIGHNVLILTSQGASGLAAIDLAQNVFNMKVIAACSSERKCAVVRPMGVMMTTTYGDEALQKNVLDATFHKGVDAIIDTVGGRWFDVALKCLKPGGHVLTLGFSSNEVPSVSLLEIHRLRATLSGVWLGGVAQDDPGRFKEIIETIIGWYDERYINPAISAKFSLDDINKCLDHIEHRESIGKVVLMLREGATSTIDSSTDT